jgi:protein TonB
VTSLGARLVALGVSTAAHAALFAPMGHSARGPSDEIVSVDVQTDPSPSIEALEPEPAAVPPAGPAAHWAGHTHPYPVPPSHDSTPHDPNLVHLLAPPAAAAHVPPAAAAPAETSSDDMPRFSITVGDAAGDPHGAVSPSGTAPPHDDDSAAVPETYVDAKARLVRGVAPSYPGDARADGVEGDVLVELVVAVSGAVESARVVRGVGHGLDDEALRAVRHFVFAPAPKGGRAVRVRMGWSVQFRLR